MEEFKNHGKKWLYWFTIGVALIVVFKVLDQFNNVTEAVGEFFKALAPIISGAFVAYILLIPCKKFEKLYQRSRVSFLKRLVRLF